MGFDLSTAKPVKGGFDISTARPVRSEVYDPATQEQALVDIPSRLLKGARDPITGLAQKLYAAVPESVQQSGTDVNKWLYDKTGGVLGLEKPLPEEIAAEENAYQKARQATGQNGFDWARLVGNVASPTSLMTMGYSLPAKVLPAIAQGMAIGGSQAAMQPVYSSEGKTVSDAGVGAGGLRQIASGATVGAAIPAGLKMSTSAVKGVSNFLRGIFSAKYNADKFLKEVTGEQTKHIIKAMEQADPGMTAQQALGKYVRKNGNVLGSRLARVEDDLAKAETTGDVLNAIKFKQQSARLALIEKRAGNRGEMEAQKVKMASEDAVNYGKLANETIDPRSNAQKLADAAKKASYIASKKSESKISALQDYGQLKTMEDQLLSRAKGNPPTTGIVRKTSVRPERRGHAEFSQGKERLSPSTGNMWNPPRYKGQPRGPAKYAPQMPQSKEAGIAANELKKIASARRTEEETAKSIADLFARNAGVESRASLDKFFNKPSFQKALNDAKDMAAEKGVKWPENGELFSVEALKLIKQQIAGQIKVKAKAGTITDQEQAAVTNTLKKFSSWLKGKSKAFAEAEAAHIKNINPINRMDIAREMMKRLSKAESDDLAGATEGVNQYLSGLRDAPRMLKNRLGWSRFKTLEQAVPEDADMYKKIGRQLLDEQMGKKLSKMKISSLNTVDGKTVLQFPKILSTPVVVANSILHKVGKKDITPEIHRILEKNVSDPQKLLAIIKTKELSPAKKIVLDAIMKAQQAGIIGASQQAGRSTGQ